MNLKKPGEDNSLAFIDVSQGNFRDQVDCVSDELRQLAGNPEFQVDPLSAPYVLFVNGYTGSDAFVGGLYQNTEADIERRISNQKLECGYSEARPFKTINRAAIEAAIITSRSFFSNDGQRNRALVSIVVAPGEYMAMNGEGLVDNAANFPARTDGFIPNDDQLTAFNDDQTGGIILPRGCSLVSLDLRKTVVRPQAVPARAEEAADYSNRRAIFKVTGTGYYYGFTFKDNENIQASHHLLSCFEFTPRAELEKFYSKVLKSFASAQIDASNTVPQIKETQIVAKKGDLPEFETDGVGSASPYIYNTSIRSIYGLCGVFANGAVADGFKSMVIAQFTGVSLQKDLNCWQLYRGGNWNTNPSSYTEYINNDPNDTRMDPKQRSFHIRAVNDSIIQEVSVFAIGQGVHHWTETGGELTITNSNSNFGGVSGLSEGYKAKAAPQDGPYTVTKIKRSIDPLSKSSNITQVRLGVIAENQVNTLSGGTLVVELETPLDPSSVDDTQPAVVKREDFSLKEGDFIWVENPAGPDYRAVLTSNPYNKNNPNQIIVKAYDDPNNEAPTDIAFTADRKNNFLKPGTDDDVEGSAGAAPSLGGLVLYIRRVLDVRSVEERRTAIIVNFGNSNRLPPRDYVLRETGVDPDSPDANNIDGSNIRRAAITASGIFDNQEGQALLELRPCQRPDFETDYNPDKFYRAGDVIRRENKHFIARRNTAGNFDESAFDENYVHMEEEYAPAGFFKNAQPIIVFDGDTDQSEDSTKLGFTIRTQDNNPILAQIRGATDYQGAQELLQSLGKPLVDVNESISPIDPTRGELEIIDIGATPVGSVSTIESRRPSVVRMFGQAYEWTGFLNYSKALPNYQQVLSPSNKFSYYFTSNAGGIVYANGFNEEGLAVSPRGLEDVRTGEFLPLEEVGNPDRSFDLPEEFSSLTVTGSLNVGDFGDTKVAGVERKSIVSLASIEDIQDPSMGSFAAKKNNQITGDKVMTLESTNLWAETQGFARTREGVQTVYVNPNGGRTDPLKGKGSNTLFNDPPTTPSKATNSIKKAADFINATYNKTERVRLLLGPGIYKESGVVQLDPIMEVRSFNFEALSNLCDDQDSDAVPSNSLAPGDPKTGQKAFMGQSDVGGVRSQTWNQTRDYLENGPDNTDNNHPCFLTRPRFGLTRTGAQKLFIDPLRINFNTSGTILGCVWFGLATTCDVLTDEELVDFFPNFPKSTSEAAKLAAVNRIKTANRADRLTQYVREACFDSATLAFLDTTSCIYSAGDLEVKNCAFEAIGPAPSFSGGRSRRAVIGCSAENVILRGLWFIGSCKIERADNDNSLPPLVGLPENSGYVLSGHHNAVVSSELVDQEENGAALSIGFGGPGIFNDPAQRVYNTMYNNFHFVNDKLEYVVNRPNMNLNFTGDFRVEPSRIRDQPPAFKGLIAPVENLKQFGSVWSNLAVRSNDDRQGLSGYLGFYRDDRENTTPLPTKGIEEIPNGTNISKVNSEFLFQVAGLGEAAGGVADRNFDYAALGNGGVDDNVDFAAINIKSTAISQGVNVQTAVICSNNTLI